MQIHTLNIQNFGIYKGNIELSLRDESKSSKHKPIVLIGGKNGAGKSTIFEAIKLCLYGQKSLVTRASNAEYKDYLKSRINWFTPQDESTFIEITFSIFRDNYDPILAKTYEYRILREWYKTTSSGLHEKFQIYEDGTQLELDPTFWQDFIEDIIPQGVVNLFFFDGEKIQDLAEGGNTELKRSIKSLLNLEIMKSLSDDLEQIKKKHIEKNQDKSTRDLIQTLRREIELKSQEHQKLLIERAEIQQSISSISSSTKQYEKDLKSEGGEYYKERDRLNVEKSNCETILSQLSDSIGRMCGDYIPFMLSPALVSNTKKSLANELTVSEKEIMNEVLSDKKSHLEDYLRSILKDAKIENSTTTEILGRISGFTDSWISGSDAKRDFDFNTQELRRSLDILNVLKDKSNEIDEYYNQIEIQSRRLKRLKDSLNRAIDNDKVRLIHEKINIETLKLGSKQKEIQLVDEKIDKILKDIKESNKKLEKLFQEADKVEDAKVNFDRIENLQLILNLFEKELTNQKVQLLEDEILNCYSRIHRKTGFIRSISINPETFDVALLDKTNKKIPVAQLSAGEKQVYAISILWALAKLSGRPLPMIIDTPLGRLDSSHRDNLVNNFFPFASHQVVILSTDTEIDQSYYNNLNKHLSHSYNIDFNLDDSSSNIESGYFYDSPGSL